MVGAESGFSDGKRPFVHRFRLVVLAGVPVVGREVVETISDIRMIGAQRRFPDRQGSPIQGLRLFVLTLDTVKRCQIAKQRRDVGIIRAEDALHNFQELFRLLRGFRVSPLFVEFDQFLIEHRGLSQRIGDGFRFGGQIRRPKNQE